jgi:hypothetical protein
MTGAIYIGYAKLYNKTLSIQAAIDKLRKYGLFDVINVLSRVDLTLGYGYEDIQSVQIPLLTKKFACKEIAARIREFLTRNHNLKQSVPVVLFHPLQIINAIKLCLKYCQNKQTTFNGITPWKSLVEALLIINDHLTPKSFKRLMQKDFEEATQYITMNALSNRIEPEKNLIGRWMELGFEAYRLVNQSDADYLDITTEFAKKYGINYREYFACCFGFYALWRVLRENKEEVDKGMISIKLKTKGISSLNFDIEGMS